MKLSANAKKELRDLLISTDYIFDNKVLYNEIFKILKNDLDFFYDVKLNINDYFSSAEFDLKMGILNINPEENYYYSKKLAYSFVSEIQKEDIEELTKYIILMVMLHESAHAEQFACAKDNYSSYNEINELYKSLFNLNTWWNFPYQFFYLFKGEAFSFERYANLISFRELYSIVPNKFKNLIAINFLYNYLFNYYEHKGKIITPIKKTMNKSLIREKITSIDVPLNLRILHGMDINMQEYKEYIDFISDLDLSDKTYKILGKKIDVI